MSVKRITIMDNEPFLRKISYEIISKKCVYRNSDFTKKMIKILK